jgi:hypothetical protein
MNELLKLKIELMRVTEELHKSNAKICELSRILYEKDLAEIEARHAQDSESQN